tara:strand:- start:40 stop:243 length:204 start_codon:yes stop_codon:yes gene_type:complete
MVLTAPLCYTRVINKKEKKMDYENDYNLLEDVAEEIDVWEDLEDEDKKDSFDSIDHLEQRQLLEEQF